MFILFCYLLFINFILFILMGVDKHKAIKKQRRIPEKVLLWLGVLGGGAAGLLSQKIFHHKTRKKYFTMTYLIGSILALMFIFFARKYGVKNRLFI